MSIVTQLPDVLAQSSSFVSGRSKIHGIVTYRGGDGRKKAWAGTQVAVCGVFTNQH